MTDSPDATHSEITLQCVLDSKEALHNAYMPFIKGGGVFVATQENLPLNTNVILAIQILDDPTEHIRANIAWITPLGAQRGKKVGVGVQFIGKEGQAMQHQIETYVVGMSDANKDY